MLTLNLDDLTSAFHHVAANEGCAGVDDVIISNFARNLNNHLKALLHSIIDKIVFLDIQRNATPEALLRRVEMAVKGKDNLHQPSTPARRRHFRDLPKALADRNVLQSAQALHKYQDVYRHQCQRDSDPDLHRLHHDAAYQAPAPEKYFSLEPIESGGSAAAADLRLPQHVRLAQRSIPRAALGSLLGSA